MKESMQQSKNKKMVSLHFPQTVPREEVLERVGVELGLRLRDDTPHRESIIVDGLTDANQRRALALDGTVMVSPDGRPSGTLSVKLVRNTPLTSSEIVQLVDTLIWGEVELQQMADEEVKVPPRSKPKVLAVQGQSGRRSPPRESASKRSSPKRSRRKKSEGAYRAPGHPSDLVCYSCQRAGRPAKHSFR